MRILEESRRGGPEKLARDAVQVVVDKGTVLGVRTQAHSDIHIRHHVRIAGVVEFDHLGGRGRGHGHHGALLWRCLAEDKERSKGGAEVNEPWARN